RLSASRISGSSKILTCLNSAPTARSAATVCAENPHCGKSGVPFMNSTTGLEPSSVLIRSTTSICTLPLQFAPLGKLRQQTPLLSPAHGRPASDLLARAQTADAPAPRIERASSASRRHRSAPLMDGQRPISSPVRRQPTHQPRASSAQTLMHGDGGRSSDSAASNALNYGGASPILQTPQDSSVQAYTITWRFTP